MAKQRVYGTPTGTEGPSRKQRAAEPATDAQVHAAYQAHMREAHEQFLTAHRAGQTPRVSRSSSYDSQGKYKMPTGLRGKQIQGQLKKVGE